MEGVKLYHKLTSFGRDKQIKLAEEFMNDGKVYDSQEKNTEIPDSAGCIRLGSLMLCYEPDVEELETEYSLLKEANFEVEWWDKQKIELIHGNKGNFYAAIFFPKDGVIDSMMYAKKLVEFCKTKGLEVREGKRVSDIIEDKDSLKNLVKVVIDGEKEAIYAEKVVMATGGLYLNDTLNGILSPCYSYLTCFKNVLNEKEGSIQNKSQNSVNPKISTMRNSPNFFTLGCSHDWIVCQGYMRVSGEDGFTALKPPRMKHRCNMLETWASDNYPYLLNNGPERQYENGIYSDTPDFIPLLGKATDESNITYLVGCNSLGQASLSGAAYLVPGLLGERKLAKDEIEMANFLSIQRFTLNRFKRPKF